MLHMASQYCLFHLDTNAPLLKSELSHSRLEPDPIKKIYAQDVFLDRGNRQFILPG